ncbi:MAG TPA: carboxypeptidase regulatory-like domain-containing protein [Pyrinomonadaceae bacterium]|nr:carboxypeptidase regulatory-like domain-containing protein [Pyrinomonadaceae bacterium]
MSKSVKLFSLILFLLAVSSVGMAQSQAGSGQIAGQVADTNGAAVPNATVKVTNKGTGLERTATTSSDGLFTIVLLPPGTYIVVAEATGFAAATLDDVVVNVGRSADLTLTVGASGVQATVLVAADAVQVTRNESDAVLTETAINTLPINGRRFQDFVTLTPTAQIDPSRGQISLSGQKGINGNINVDGVDYNQPFFGGIRGGERSNLAFTIPQEAIKEFQVVASGYSAEFGRSTGGIVNAVTKSGDNSVRGSAFYLLRPNRLARGNEFTDALQQQKLNALGITPTLAPTQHQFGGSIGGPIKRDKLFYFGSYEQQRFRAPRQIVFAFPVGFPAGVTLNAAQQEVFSFYNAEQTEYLQTNDAYAGLGRVDWNIADNHRFNVRFSASKNDALNAASRGETSVDPTTRQALSTNGTEQDKTKIGVAQLVSNFGSDWINELRLQWAREDRPRLSNSEVPQIVTSFATYGAGGADTSSFLPNFEYDTRHQVADSLTLLTGNHNFKFGGEYSRLFATQTFGFNQFGQYNLSLGGTSAQVQDALLRLSNSVTPQAGTTQAILGRFDSTNASFFKQIGNLEAGMTVHELAFFGQDNWRLTPRLSINYGLRLEQQYNPTPDASNTQIVDVVRKTIFPIRGTGYDATQIQDSGWQIGPRFGFAYDPEGKGKMVIRGFAGVYYARTPLIVLASPVNNYRATPGDVSTRLPFTGFSQATFDAFLNSAAGTQYKTITGCNPAAAAGTDARNRCTPNTVYRQFAIVGINLNTSPLSSLPILTTTQIAGIASGLGLNPSPFVGAQVVGQAEDFKNPRSVQFGFGVEREIARNFVVGIDYANVSTHRISRFRDLNVPAPLTGAQYVAFLQANNTAANFATMSAPGGIVQQILASGRQFIAINTPGGFINLATNASLAFPTGSVTTRQRPTQAQQGFALGAVAIRESTGKSLYRGLTFRARLIQKRLHVNAYYTFSRLLSDDDNERQDGVGYADPYDLRSEYYLSRLHRESQFMANPIFFLPHGFEVSSAIRLRSGAPFNPTVGADLNGDTVNNERPLLVPGVTYQRNFFVNRGIFEADARVQKGFNFDENRRLIFSAEFFNILNRPNLLVGTTAAPSSATAFGGGGQFCTVASQLCGSGGPPSNPNFLQVRDPNTGVILINNVNPGSQVFQMQLGVRLQF